MMMSFLIYAIGCGLVVFLVYLFLRQGLGLRFTALNSTATIIILALFASVMNLFSSYGVGSFIRVLDYADTATLLTGVPAIHATSSLLYVLPMLMVLRQQFRQDLVHLTAAVTLYVVSFTLVGIFLSGIFGAILLSRTNITVSLVQILNQFGQQIISTLPHILSFGIVLGYAAARLAVWRKLGASILAVVLLVVAIMIQTYARSATAALYASPENFGVIAIGTQIGQALINIMLMLAAIVIVHRTWPAPKRMSPAAILWGSLGALYIVAGCIAAYVSLISLASDEMIPSNPHDWLIYLLAGHYSSYLVLSGLAGLGFAFRLWRPRSTSPVYH